MTQCEHFKLLPFYLCEYLCISSTFETSVLCWELYLHYLRYGLPKSMLLKLGYQNSLRELEFVLRELKNLRINMS